MDLQLAGKWRHNNFSTRLGYWMVSIDRKYNNEFNLGFNCYKNQLIHRTIRCEIS